jgi:hypothetical protein
MNSKAITTPNNPNHEYRTEITRIGMQITIRRMDRFISIGNKPTRKRTK